MRPLPELLFDPQCPTATSAVRVLSAFGFKAQPATAWRGAPDFPVLLVHDRTGGRLPLVAPLRREGFRGPVVVLAGIGRIEIFRRHRVLCFGTDSVAVWAPGRPLGNIVAAVSRLRPIGGDVLRLVQLELTIPADFLTAWVEPCLARLRSNDRSGAAFQELHNLVTRAKTWSARGCHAEVAIDGRKATVSSHFRYLLNEIESGAIDINRTADELGQAFSAWMAVAATDTP